MLYEEPGPLLARAGALLSSGAPDEQVVTQLRSIGVQLKRLGAMWPDLFVTLQHENAILLRARAQIAEQLQSAHIAVDGIGGSDADDPDDPVALYRRILRQLNDALPVLHQHRDQPAGAAALATLRHAIREAGRVQAVMVDKAWSA